MFSRLMMNSAALNTDELSPYRVAFSFKFKKRGFPEYPKSIFLVDFLLLRFVI